MPGLGLALELAMALGEASVGDDVWAQLTAPSNGNSSKTTIVSRLMGATML
jgi:hypothetical protein